MRFKSRGGLFCFGGICYGLIEIVWRGRTHWSMLLTGGAVFLSLVRLFERVRNFPSYLKCLLGGMVITLCEFCSGCIFNRMLKLNVWDYSKNRFNYKGQICPFYSCLWVMLSYPIMKICAKIKEDEY